MPLDCMHCVYCFRRDIVLSLFIYMQQRVFTSIVKLQSHARVIVHHFRYKLQQNNYNHFQQLASSALVGRWRHFKSCNHAAYLNTKWSISQPLTNLFFIIFAATCYLNFPDPPPELTYSLPLAHFPILFESAHTAHALCVWNLIGHMRNDNISWRARCSWGLH